eukprot:CAMPEP_0169292424 /NCGR_PEP_ID=MMETSP1016-20121227/62752_1 /TAXON_ID=342587 /ORGANISM="Karlodinium micrum, Strain CCMP2283" /LENGTH=97 /DNA_ID=CAMNT_0009383053 /DNA_START=92 /DNA_END=386 /DNA_ORIENTATION=-
MGGRLEVQIRFCHNACKAFGDIVAACDETGADRADAERTAAAGLPMSKLTKIRGSPLLSRCAFAVAMLRGGEMLLRGTDRGASTALEGPQHILLRIS